MNKTFTAKSGKIEVQQKAESITKEQGISKIEQLDNLIENEQILQAESAKLEAKFQAERDGLKKATDKL